MRFALAKIERLLLERLEPCMRVAVSEEKEQTFDLDAFAIGEKILQAARAEVGQALHQHVDLMKGFAFRQFVQQFEQGAFGR